MASATTDKDSFPQTLWNMVEDRDENYDEIIWWNKGGDGFLICEEKEKFLASKILPKYKLKNNNYSSFERQLLNYGFHKRKNGKKTKAYHHDRGYFNRNQPELSKITKRKKKGTDSGLSSEAESCQPDQHGTLQEIEITPNWGPLEGGTPFRLNNLQVDVSVPHLIVYFGTKHQVRVGREPGGNSWLGNTPPGDVLGAVTVIITTPDGDDVGRTKFTYKSEIDRAYEVILSNSEQRSSFLKYLEQLQFATQESGLINTKSDTLGLSKHEGQQQSVEMLLRLIYTAAQIGEEQFIRLVFGTSVGRTAFEAYKNKSPLPEDIADANGHEKIASYFRVITERFSKDDGTSQMQSKVVNWSELVRAESELQSDPSEINLEELQKDDTSETAYFGDTEASSPNSNKEMYDSDDAFKTPCFKDSVGEEDEKQPEKYEIFLRKSICCDEGESASSGPLPKQRRFILEDNQVQEHFSNVSVANMETKRKYGDISRDPPQLSANLPPVKEIQTPTKHPNDAHLPVDILLLTVKNYEFLACYMQMNNPFKCWFDGLGYVYFEDAGESQEEKVTLALLRCNEGSSGAGGSLIHAFTVLKPKGVISVGTCSGLNPEETKLGDVVISAKLTTYGSKVVTNNQEQSTGIRTIVSRRFLDLIKDSAHGWEAPLKNPEDQEIKVHSNGELLSGPELVTAESWRKELAERYPQAVAIDTERLFTAAFDLQIEWLVVKGISNYADDNEFTYENWSLFASANAASLVTKILNDPVVFKRWPHYQGTWSEMPVLSARKKSPELSCCCYQSSQQSRLVSTDHAASQKEKEIETKGHYKLTKYTTKHHTVVPLEIDLRGPLALEVYNKALAEGKACVKRVPVMLIGQDRSGKTSLKNSLMGKPFNKDEDSTVGIDVDPSYFKVSSEIWRPGENDQVTNDMEATSFEYHAARLVAEELKEEKRDTRSMRSENSASELPVDSRKSAPSSETSKDAKESIQTSKDLKVDVRKRVPKTFSSPTQRRKEHSLLALPKIPDEIATLIKKLIKEVEKVQDEEEIYSVLWDFGGQSVYYATHPLFITTKAMYLLVYDLSCDPYAMAEPVAKQGMYRKSLCNHGPKSNLDYLKFWMTSVASLASQDEDQHVHVRSGRVQVNIPPVFLICTHADEPYDGKNPFDLAREILGSLKTKPYKNQLYKDVFVVNNKMSGTVSECPEVIRLRENVLAVAKELPQMKESIPIKWLKYEKALQVTMKEGNKWISFEMAKQIASEVCHIDDDKELSTLLDFLHDHRILIHFDDTPALNNLVVLDPQWLVDVFKMVITVAPYDQQEAEFEELWWRLESKGIVDEKLLEHVWSFLLDEQETSASLTEIMEKFSLLCPLPSSDASCGKQYLVPSMLNCHPPKGTIQLVDSAQIPSLFFKFESGQVPPGLFPRLVLKFFQWSQDEFWSSENPDLYHSFARFYTSADDDCSVILLCHSSSIEVAVHRGNISDISANFNCDAFEVACARAVRKKLGLMLECMREEFHWLKNMKYEVGVICPICCQGRVAKYNCMHSQQGCEQEECLHFWSESELLSVKRSIRCCRLATAQINKVPVNQIAPWIEIPSEQLTIVGRDGKLLTPEEENDEKLLALPGKDLESLLSQPCDSKEVVFQLKDYLQLDQASLKQPDPGTQRLIRCLARKAKQSNRFDVFKHLREITPAGTTGPLLPECRDIRQIPYDQMRELTVTLSGGDEWKVLAAELDLKQHEIRYLDSHRIRNPCDALLTHIANQGDITVGFLYNKLIKCKLPVVADLL